MENGRRSGRQRGGRPPPGKNRPLFVLRNLRKANVSGDTGCLENRSGAHSVWGSSPPPSVCSQVAQLAEHSAVNRGVVGSSPTPGVFVISVDDGG